ncbi:hypothetical protein M758_3G190900 [Ceratodon purpureus]|uniref:Uncharacterized protein n=1 Tax=Ceratodon purpureus TaxID=3225 RepID=A0A8T0IMW4_CERPU|nr:hypothetical protein KC19_3G191600 [Ceratodon purpureus]KAG0623646.1 hypothetical protein M758_3G190900 [Ceratodon purpureus]
MSLFWVLQTTLFRFLAIRQRLCGVVGVKAQEGFWKDQQEEE